jgi:hypothetical protein
MNEAAMTEKLVHLSETITMAPVKGGAAGTSLNEGTYIGDSPTEASPEDMLEQLSLQVKYLLFDLEATRRENRYLRQILESRPRKPQDDADNDLNLPGL